METVSSKIDLPLGINLDVAKEIMGLNILDVGAAMEYLGYRPSKEQLDYFSFVPFHGDVLEEAKKKDWVLAAIPPYSICDIYHSNGIGKRVISLRIPHFLREGFGQSYNRWGWQLVSKSHLPDSANKSWSRQFDVLQKGFHYAPSARTMVYILVMWRLSMEETLLSEMFVRTATPSCENNHVLVGSFEGKIEIDDSLPDSYGYGHVGVCAVKTPCFHGRRLKK